MLRPFLSVDGVKALIVGEGPERERFSGGHARQRTLPVILKGEELARAYACAEIFFNPSITETFGNVTLEAMACATTPLCATAAGSTSLVEHEVTGLLAQPTSSDFRDALARLRANRDLRIALGEAARKRSLDFSWRAILLSLVDNYYEAIDAYQPGPKQSKRR